VEIYLHLPACLHGLDKNYEEDCLILLIIGKVKGKVHPTKSHEGTEVE
jgi:hypothetical protein